MDGTTSLAQRRRAYVPLHLLLVYGMIQLLLQSSLKCAAWLSNLYIRMHAWIFFFNSTKLPPKVKSL